MLARRGVLSLQQAAAAAPRGAAVHTTGALPSEDRKSEERAALMPFSEYAALKRRNGDRATLAALPGAVAGLMGCSAVIASVYSDVFTAPPEAPQLLWCVLLPQCAIQRLCRRLAHQSDAAGGWIPSYPVRWLAPVPGWSVSSSRTLSTAWPGVQPTGTLRRRWPRCRLLQRAHPLRRAADAPHRRSARTTLCGASQSTRWRTRRTITATR